MPEPGNNVVSNMMDVLENKQDADSAEKPPSLVAEPGSEQNSVVTDSAAPETTESNIVTAPSEHVAEPKMEVVAGGGSTPLGAMAPESAPVVLVPKVIYPYTGAFKECDSIKLTPAGIVKPEYCCKNTQQGLAHWAAVYTVVYSDGRSEDLCAQCASHYEASSEA